MTTNDITRTLSETPVADLAEALSDFTVKDLRAFATASEIPGRGARSKAQLIGFIVASVDEPEMAPSDPSEAEPETTVDEGDGESGPPRKLEQPSGGLSAKAAKAFAKERAAEARAEAKAAAKAAKAAEAAEADASPESETSPALSPRAARKAVDSYLGSGERKQKRDRAETLAEALGVEALPRPYDKVAEVLSAAVVAAAATPEVLSPFVPVERTGGGRRGGRTELLRDGLTRDEGITRDELEAALLARGDDVAKARRYARLYLWRVMTGGAMTDLTEGGRLYIEAGTDVKAGDCRFWAGSAPSGVSVTPYVDRLDWESSKAEREAAKAADESAAA